MNNENKNDKSFSKSFHDAIGKAEEKKQALIALIKEKDPKGPYRTAYALAGAAVLVSFGFVLLGPFGAVGGAILGAGIGYKWGEHKWKIQLEDFEKTLTDSNEDEASIIEAATQLKIENESSIVNKIPVIGSIYRTVTKKSDQYKEELMVADLSGGIGVAIGYEIGAVIGTFIAPGIGTLIGSAVGAVVGMFVGFIGGAKLSNYLKTKKNIDANHQRLITAGGLAGAGLGAAIGGLVGTFIIPGIGTALGAAIGASIGAADGMLCGHLARNNKNGFFNQFSQIFNSAAGVSSGAIVGGLIGSVVPFLGTALGAAIGAIFGGGITWYTTRMGKRLNQQEEEIRNEITNKLSGDEKPTPSSDIERLGTSEPKPQASTDVLGTSTDVLGTSTDEFGTSTDVLGTSTDEFGTSTVVLKALDNSEKSQPIEKESTIVASATIHQSPTASPKPVRKQASKHAAPQNHGPLTQPTGDQLAALHA